MAFKTDEAGKIFVGGLNLQTTQENLKAYFGEYGEIVDSIVMKHNENGKSRGFGFVTYKDPAVISTVLEAGPHVLDGKTIDAKVCTKRNERRERKDVNSDSLKVFLGGLPLDITENDLMQAFKKFGEVKEIVIMYDKEKQKPRGFGFLTFDSQDALQRACGEHFIVINGKQVECKAAQPRNARPHQPYGGPPQGYGMTHGGSNAYQQPPSYNYQQQNYGGSCQNYNPPQAGYAAPSAGYAAPSAGYASSSAGYAAPSAGYSAPSAGHTPAQRPSASQYDQHGYGNGGYDQNYNSPQVGGGSNSATGGGNPSGYNAYQQPPSYNYHQQNYGGGYQNYNSPQAGYAAPPPVAHTPAQRPPASQYGYGNGGYNQDGPQYRPIKGRQSGNNGQRGNTGAKSEGGHGSHGSRQTYHPYK